MSPSNLSNLTAAKLNITTTLAAITANPKPSYSVDGKSISWAEYFATLTDRLEKINELLVVENGPYELRSQGIP